MIRINLLESARPVAAAPASPLRVANLPALGGLVLVLVALAVGWRHWQSAQTTAVLTREIAAARAEEMQLTGILQQVQRFEARRQALQQRVALIDELRKGQTAPVHMIDQISRALPDGLWLTRLQQNGADVTLEGECLSLTALSDFVGNLEASRYFGRPVEILDSAVVPARESLPDVIRFAVKGTFRMAGLDTKSPAKPKAAGGKRG